jgi:hypothetical protein
MNNVVGNNEVSHMNVLANVRYALVSFSLFQYLHICANHWSVKITRLEYCNAHMPCISKRGSMQHSKGHLP